MNMDCDKNILRFRFYLFVLFEHQISEWIMITHLRFTVKSINNYKFIIHSILFTFFLTTDEGFFRFQLGGRICLVFIFLF